MLDATCSISCSMLLIFLSNVHHIYQTCNTSADICGKRLVGFYIILKLTRQSSLFPHMRTERTIFPMEKAIKEKKHYINFKVFFCCNVGHLPLPGMKVEHPPGFRVGICLRGVKDPLSHVHKRTRSIILAIIIICGNKSY